MLLSIYRENLPCCPASKGPKELYVTQTSPLGELNFLQRLGIYCMFSTLPWHSCRPSTLCIHGFHFPVIAKELVFGLCCCSCRCFTVLLGGGCALGMALHPGHGASLSAWAGMADGTKGWVQGTHKLLQSSAKSPAQQTAPHACTSSTVQYVHGLQCVCAHRFIAQPQGHHQGMQNAQLNSRLNSTN